MTKVIILSDFDGTATKTVGSRLVFTPFYKSLLVNEGMVNEEYEYLAKMKSPEERMALFEKEFVDGSHPFLICPEAVNFYHEVLKQESVKLVFITKNQKDYIQTMLAFQGFTEEELAKTAISMPFRQDGALVNKGAATISILECYGKFAELVLILDDDAVDCRIMSSTAGIYFRNLEKKVQIDVHHEAVGHFKWKNYQECIENALSATRASKAFEKPEISVAEIGLFGSRDKTEEVFTVCNSPQFRIE